MNQNIPGADRFKASDKVIERYPNGLSLEVVTKEEQFSALCDEWNGLVAKAGVHIFQTHEWQRIWWKYFGKNKQLYILLFRDANRLVGIIPLFMDSFKMLGSQVYGCLKLIGSRVMQPAGGSLPVELAFGDYLDVIAHPGYVERLMAALNTHLETHRFLYDEIILEEVPETSPLLLLLVPRLTEEGWKTTISDASVCLQIHFPASWQEFLEGLSRNERKHTRRSLRSIFDKELFEIQTAKSKQEVLRSFGDLVNIHQRRWNNLGQPGIFADKRVHDFFLELTLCFHKKGWLWARTASGGGRCVANKLMFRYDGVVYGVQSGFDDTSPLRNHSPGKGLLYSTIQEAIKSGFKVYDFLRGEEEYKLLTVTHARQNKNIFVRHFGKGRVRLQLSKALRSYEHLKRKMCNEKFVLDVHLQQGKLPGIRNYLNSLYQRMSKRFSGHPEDRQGGA